MTMIEAVKSVFSNYAKFNGRARRSEYWWFVLANLIVGAILGGIEAATGITILATIYSLAVFIPGLAVSVRRLHDIGKSGWFVLLGLIPLVGGIILIIWSCKDSEPGENKFGPNPKEDVVVEAAVEQ